MLAHLELPFLFDDLDDGNVELFEGLLGVAMQHLAREVAPEVGALAAILSFSAQLFIQSSRVQPLQVLKRIIGHWLVALAGRAHYSSLLLLVGLPLIVEIRVDILEVGSHPGVPTLKGVVLLLQDWIVQRIEQHELLIGVQVASSDGLIELLDV